MVDPRFPMLGKSSLGRAPLRDRLRVPGRKGDSSLHRDDCGRTCRGDLTPCFRKSEDSTDSHDTGSENLPAAMPCWRPAASATPPEAARASNTAHMIQPLKPVARFAQCQFNDAHLHRPQTSERRFSHVSRWDTSLGIRIPNFRCSMHQGECHLLCRKL